MDMNLHLSKFSQQGLDGNHTDEIKEDVFAKEKTTSWSNRLQEKSGRYF